MKCNRCAGNGKYTNIFGDIVRCDFCYGTGKIKYEDDGKIVPIGKQKPKTNEEWFCQLPTKEKAKRIINIAVNSDCDYRTIVEWLKQPHTNE